MVTENGMSDTVGNVDLATFFDHLSSETKQKIEAEVRRFIEEGRQRATALLTEHRKELDLLAKALVEYEVLNLDEMKKVVEGEKLTKMKSQVKGALKLPEIVLPPGMGGSGAGSARIQTEVCTSERRSDGGSDCGCGGGASL